MQKSASYNADYQLAAIANSPVTEEVKLAVNALNLPNGIQQQMEAAQIGTSPRILAALELEYLNLEKLKHVDAVIRAYLDTLWIDSARIYLEQEGSMEALCALIPLELKKDTFKTKTHLITLETMADQLLATDSLSKKGEEMKSFCDFYQTLLRAQNRPGGFYNLNEQEKDLLNTFSKRGVSIAANAQYVLDFIAQKSTNYVLPDLNLDKSGSIYTTNDMRTPALISQAMVLYPNPTNGFLEVTVTQSLRDGMLIVTNLMGQRIASVRVFNDRGYYDLSGHESGIYLVGLYEEGTLIEQQKVVLHK